MKFIVICGPTASGKSGLAIEVAKKLKVKIINADAIQVYRDIPIITAQPTFRERGEIEHLLYGFKDGDEAFSVNDWLQLVLREIAQVNQDGYLPVLVGGTGMYIKMLTQGFKDLPHLTVQHRQEIEAEIAQNGLSKIYEDLCTLDSDYQNKLNANDTHRIIRAYGLLKYYNLNSQEIANMPNKLFFNQGDYKIFYLKPEREALYLKSERRIVEMLAHNAIEEVAQAKTQYQNQTFLSKAIGYREISTYLDGNLDYDAMVSLFQQNTRNFIKRQYTWFNNQLEEHIALKESDVNEILQIL